MRDIDGLLRSLINIDRKSLLAILTSEVEAARRIVTSTGQRTAGQRAKRQMASARITRIERIVSYFRHGTIDADMLETDVNACRMLEDKLAREQQD